MKSLFTIMFLKNAGTSAKGQYHGGTFKYVGVVYSKIFFLLFETAWSNADDAQCITED